MKQDKKHFYGKLTFFFISILILIPKREKEKQKLNIVFLGIEKLSRNFQKKYSATSSVDFEFSAAHCTWNGVEVKFIIRFEFLNEYQTLMIETRKNR